MTLRHVFFCLLAWMGTWASVCRGTPATATGGMVATVHPSGTDAGVEVLKRGGNAIDAAVAAALTLGVVNGQNSGIGGGCFILIRLADGEFVAIDGREMAPAAATRDMYLRDGKPQPEWSLTGPLASGVPGALAAYEHAIGRYGRLSLRELLLPAAETAEDGFALDASYADALGKAAKKLARFEGSRAALLKPDGSPYEKGDLLKLPDLARTYRAIADKGTGWFYRGPFARKVGEWMRANGGILSAEDFAGYRVCVRKPVVTTYRQYTVVGFPPPSSGGVHVAEILNVLEHFDLKTLYQENPARFYHVVAEAMKLAFADRAHWLGDPDFADVPRGLIDKQYAAELARRIKLDRAADVPTHGQPPRWQDDHFGVLRDDFVAPGASDGLSAAVGHRRQAAHRTHVGAFTPSVGLAHTMSLSTDPSPPAPLPASGARGALFRTGSGRHTTHIAAVDREGNWVAITATINTGFGSKVIVPTTGVVLNDEMDDFSAAPGVANTFGLLGAEANAIVPAKRPLSSMSPTIVLSDGRPILTLGAAGGPKIITHVLMTILYHLDLGMDLPDALAAPRVHHQWRPDRLLVERSLDAAIVQALRDLGHEVRRERSVGIGQAIGALPDGTLIGLDDPRVAGKAAGL